ncbi:MAG TPA: 30S ribosomal protein S2 [Flavobacteriales bacterium]|jgi:small subunit ribosomal protein S2|nr:30S ribosomal protein S2 [Flavobacteriales bacterium]HAW20422.1 30S ribosomal protein S2 [Flavobacteriales bacterium]
MASTNYKDLLAAGVHFGHLKRKWNPNMAPYIFMERNGIHVIDLHKTVAKCDEAAAAIKNIARSGKKILVVATKKQAKDIVERQMKDVNMPYVTERWPGGMLTNFVTIRKAIRKMGDIDKMKTDGRFATMSKRERLQVDRQRAKLDKDLGSIADLTRLPAALFIIDVNKEHIAVREARKLNIPTFAIVDTNADPRSVDFPIPGNDDASAAIDKILSVMTDAIKEGLSERKTDRDAAKAAEDAASAAKEAAVKAAEAAAAAKAEKVEEAPAAENADAATKE